MKYNNSKTSQSNVLAWNWTTTYSIALCCMYIWNEMDGMEYIAECRVCNWKQFSLKKKHEFERKGNVKYRARLSNVFNCSIFAVGSFQTTSHTCVLCFMLVMVVCCYCTMYNVYTFYNIPSQLLFWWLICCALLYLLTQTWVALPRHFNMYFFYISLRVMEHERGGDLWAITLSSETFSMSVKRWKMNF